MRGRRVMHDNSERDSAVPTSTGTLAEARDSVASAFFRRHPDAVRHLLAEHIDDGTGHCKKCWSQQGNPRHPCNVRLFALDGGGSGDG